MSCIICGAPNPYGGSFCPECDERERRHEEERRREEHMIEPTEEAMTIEERAMEKAMAEFPDVPEEPSTELTNARFCFLRGFLAGAADTARWVPVEESEDNDEWKSFEFYSLDYSLCLMVRVPPLPGEESNG